MFKFFLGIIGGIIGATIGSSFGMPGLGFAIGTALFGIGASILFPGDSSQTQGSRIDDSKYQSATYGRDIAKHWGTVRTSGNIIWSPKLIEKRKIRHLDGDAEFWEYRYYVSMAIGLGEGPIFGVRRVFLNGKLYIDLSDTLPNDFQLQVSNQRSDILTVYTGSKEQAVDPLIQADIGAADTPAYRGLAYMIFDELPLTDYGNSRPNVSVELIGSLSPFYEDLSLSSYTGPDPNSDITLEDSNMMFAFDTMEVGIAAWKAKNHGTNYFGDFEIDFECEITSSEQGGIFGMNIANIAGTTEDVASSGSGIYITFWNIAAGGIILSTVNTSPYYIDQSYPTQNYDNTLPYYYYTAKRSGTTFTLTVYSDSARLTPVDQLSMTCSATLYSTLNAIASFDQGGSEVITGKLGRFNIDGGGGPITYQDFIVDTPGSNAGDVTMDNYGNLISTDYVLNKVYYHSGISDTIVWSNDLSWSPYAVAFWNQNMYLSDGTSLYKYQGVTSRLLWSDIFGLGPNMGAICIKDNYVYAARTIVSGSIMRFALDTNGITYETFTSTLGDPQNLSGLSFDADGNFYEAYRNDGKCYKRAGWNGAQLDVIDLPPGANSIYGIYYERNEDYLIVVDNSADEFLVYDGYSINIKVLQRAEAVTTSLSGVVEDICDEAGITSDLRDVSDLSEIEVLGYSRTKSMSARQALEPLMAAYNFDVAEIDHKLHFVLRGGSNQATITADEIGAYEYGSEPPNKMLIHRGNETEVPRELTLTYISKETDYQDGLARSVRPSIKSTDKAKIELPIVMDKDKAKQLVEIIHNTLITEKVKYGFTTSKKYLYLAPSDPITVDGFKMRIESMTKKGGLLQIEGPAEEDSNYTSSATTDDAAFTEQEISQYGPTHFEFLDIPLLFGQYHSAGFYVACHGFFPGWAGATLHSSGDGGQTFQEAISIMNESIIGTTEDVLSDGRMETWDRGNNVTVQLNKSTFTLSSSTETNVLNGTNWAAIGLNGRWEIIGFVNVTDNGDANYTLDTLLRGLKGTEHATSQHAVNDVFVMLGDLSNLSRLKMITSLIGVEQVYKVVSLYEDPQTFSPIGFTNNAVCLKPYSPVHIKATRSGTDIVITWIRRGRLENEWDDNADIPLGETTEAYEIEIFGSGNGTFTPLNRTEDATSETYTYTTAQQTTDSHTLGDPVDVRVYQISSITEVDRGYKGEATV